MAHKFALYEGKTSPYETDHGKTEAGKGVAQQGPKEYYYGGGGSRGRHAWMMQSHTDEFHIKKAEARCQGGIAHSGASRRVADLDKRTCKAFWQVGADSSNLTAAAANWQIEECGEALTSCCWRGRAKPRRSRMISGLSVRLVPSDWA